jgi:cation diffusion facilitator CzcD-associated flavoprotein CzcO
VRPVETVEGERVLVVGAGNSGCDLAVDAAQAGRETYVSVRNGLVFQPKTLFGRPRSELPLLARLPIRVQERVTRALIDVALGRPERYGLPAPATCNLHRNRPVVNGQLPHFIHHGRVRVAPGIERLDGHDVHFTDGTVRAFDTIVYTTGFKVSLPFLDSTPLEWADGVPLRVAGMTLPVGLERLYFVGLAAPRGPQLPVYSAQARLIAKSLTTQSAPAWRCRPSTRAARDPNRGSTSRATKWRRDIDPATLIYHVTGCTGRAAASTDFDAVKQLSESAALADRRQRNRRSDGGGRRRDRSSALNDPGVPSQQPADRHLQA